MRRFSYSTSLTVGLVVGALFLGIWVVVGDWFYTQEEKISDSRDTKKPIEPAHALLKPASEVATRNDFDLKDLERRLRKLSSSMEDV